MIYEVCYTQRATKALNKISNPYRARIITAIETLSLQDNPESNSNIEKLTFAKGVSRMRVNKYRVILTFEGLLITIEDVNTRGQIYKGTYYGGK